MIVGWPEGIVLCCMALGLIICAGFDGKPMEGTYKFSVTLVRYAVLFGLLYWGGFFA